jgi:hypothetical protein
MDLNPIVIQFLAFQFDQELSREAKVQRIAGASIFGEGGDGHGVQRQRVHHLRFGVSRGNVESSHLNVPLFSVSRVERQQLLTALSMEQT